MQLNVHAEKIYAGIVELSYFIIYAGIAERAYLIIYAGIVERAYFIIYAGNSGDVIDDMTSLAASLWKLYGGGGGGGVTYFRLWRGENLKYLSKYLPSL